MTLADRFGEDAASSLYMWRFGGRSFGLETRFWWTLLGGCVAACITACGSIIFKMIEEALMDNLWMTQELEDGLPYDGSAAAVPSNITAFAAWGSGKWAWLGCAVAGGAVVSAIKFVSSLVAGLLAIADGSEDAGKHSHVYPRLSPGLVEDCGSLHGHVVHGVCTLICGAVSIGCGGSVGPEAPSGAFGAGVGTGVHRLFTARRLPAPCTPTPSSTSAPPSSISRPPPRGYAEEYVLVSMALAFVNVFPGLLVTLALLLEINIATTIISVAAVEAALSSLRAQAAARAKLVEDAKAGASTVLCTMRPRPRPMLLSAGRRRVALARRRQACSVLCEVCGPVWIAPRRHHV